jgi:hypothetical protein
VIDAVQRYGLTHLIQHLAMADRTEEAHRLLALEWPTETSAGRQARAENAWWQAHERATETNSYLRDIRMVGQHAAIESDDGLARGQPAASIGLELRYALVASSTVSIAANLPSGLLTALVAKQIWSPTQALAYCREMPLSTNKVHALAALAPHLPAASLRDALDLTSTIDHPDWRTRALVALAPHLPDPELQPVLTDALDLARTLTSSYEQAAVLEELAAPSAHEACDLRKREPGGPEAPR